MTPTLFPIAAPRGQVVDPARDQYMTPAWAAQELVDQFYPDLGAGDLVLEPSCGRGAFLQALPDEVPALGIELDSQLAAEARELTGRRILCGDFRTIPIDAQPSLILGNPPFSVKLFEQFLARAERLLPDNGRCGFLLSAYMLQTPATVLRWNDRWSMDGRLLPRTLFPRAIRPLVFVMFAKDRRRIFTGGFALYRQAAEVGAMRGHAKLLLVNGEARMSCWRGLVEWALRRLGGSGRLEDLYQLIEPRRHTGNPWWKEKVRQTLQRHFQPIERGRWKLKEVA